MIRSGRYTFKRADTTCEFEQVHALNHSTFVREIPQHEETGDGRLVDKFHEKNVYFIALRDERVVGMVTVHDQAPFSVAARLPDPGVLAAPGVRPLEIRLLAIQPGERQGPVFGGLLWLVYRHVLEAGYTDLFISAFEDRLNLYKRLGFETLGPPVCSGQARFIPMCIPVARMSEMHSRLAGLWGQHVDTESTKDGVNHESVE
jgi:N-acyl-L-homoserine lactone synthetase